MGEEVAQSEAVNSAGTDETDRVSPPVDEECVQVSPKKTGTLEKSKKWYNISFMHRNASNSRSTNTSDGKNFVKMDSRHSWHLNDSMEM
jgi:hypothetical protein